MTADPDSAAEPRPEETVAEAEGASLGEAKWEAVKLLEPRFPGITAECVSFDVLAEPRMVKEFERQLRLNENVLRFLSTRVPLRPRARSKVQDVPEEVGSS